MPFPCQPVTSGSNIGELQPTIQEALLFLPKTVRGRDGITERRLRGVAKLVDWHAQIQVFRSRLAGWQP